MTEPAESPIDMSCEAAYSGFESIVWQASTVSTFPWLDFALTPPSLGGRGGPAAFLLSKPATDRAVPRRMGEGSEGQHGVSGCAGLISGSHSVD